MSLYRKSKNGYITYHKILGKSDYNYENGNRYYIMYVVPSGMSARSVDVAKTLSEVREKIKLHSKYIK